ncbi:MAG: SufE family protein [Alphaproteobacteria bacterium]|nr:SufE family protein [Alphaproteobacteria bacterium]
MSIQSILDDFAVIDEWDERYRYIIELGRKMAPLPESARTNAVKVRGCASQVWLIVARDNGKLNFTGDSDAHIVRGLIAILLALYNGKSPEEILGIDAKATLSQLGLDTHLSQQRSNGLFSMVERIRADARAAS